MTVRDGGLVGPPVDEVVETEVDGCVALFLPSTQTAAVLNETASDVWRLCDGESTFDDIVTLLARAYERPADAIRDEVASTIEKFRDDGFLT